LLRSAELYNKALKHKIKDLSLNPKGRFKILFIFLFKNNFNSDVLDIRALLILMRLLLII
jgi:hypothetical protein